MSQREVNIYFDSERFVKVEGSPTEGIKVAGSTSDLTGNELSFLFIVKEALNCLMSGKSINLHFNPFDNEEDEVTIVKCQWGRHGQLSLVEEKAKEKWHHATTIREAESRKRTFTCSRALFKRLPSRRFGQQ